MSHTVYSLQSTVYSLQSTVYSLQSTVYSLQSNFIKENRKLYYPSEINLSFAIALKCNSFFIFFNHYKYLIIIKGK